MRALLQLQLQLQALTTRLSHSSSSSIFFRAKTLWLNPNRACTQNSQVRRIWFSAPVCMGRRSCKIAGRKVYGYGGVSIVVEVSTDKAHRSVAKIREVIKDYGGKMADSGSVTFKFRRVRVVNIKATNADKDQLLSIALDAGAEDVDDEAMDLNKQLMSKLLELDDVDAVYTDQK
ncbi:hypothetical protein V8G54_006224 [Vigna mungo]|uniref:TACO1/YebC-like second and third domain-containing protein n=1 Tax=Vigna mungo TaxID=3915 RepID=A0AAQ3S678_VIGMU